MANFYYPPPPTGLNTHASIRLWLGRLVTWFLGQTFGGITVDSSFTPPFNAYFILVAEADVGAKVTVTLPDSKLCRGKIYGFVRTEGGFDSVIVPTTGDTLDGGTSEVIISNNDTPYSGVFGTMVISTGDGWDLI